MAHQYVELHARSAFSFLEGTSLPEDLIEMCESFSMPAMALVDRNGVYGAPRFHMAAKKIGTKAHVGSEVTCINGRTYPLLVETRQGYQNLCRLITRLKLRAKKGNNLLGNSFREANRGVKSARLLMRNETPSRNVTSFRLITGVPPTESKSRTALLN